MPPPPRMHTFGLQTNSPMEEHTHNVIPPDNFDVDRAHPWLPRSFTTVGSWRRESTRRCNPSLCPFSLPLCSVVAGGCRAEQCLRRRDATNKLVMVRQVRRRTIGLVNRHKVFHSDRIRAAKSLEYSIILYNGLNFGTNKFSTPQVLIGWRHLYSDAGRVRFPSERRQKHRGKC